VRLQQSGVAARGREHEQSRVSHAAFTRRKQDLFFVFILEKKYCWKKKKKRLRKGVREGGKKEQYMYKV